MKDKPGKKTAAAEADAEDGEETFYDAMKKDMAGRAGRTKSALDALEPYQRVQMEGFRPGTYLRLRFKGTLPSHIQRCHLLPSWSLFLTAARAHLMNVCRILYNALQDMPQRRQDKALPSDCQTTVHNMHLFPLRLCSSRYKRWLALQACRTSWFRTSAPPSPYW